MERCPGSTSTVTPPAVNHAKSAPVMHDGLLGRPAIKHAPVRKRLRERGAKRKPAVRGDGHGLQYGFDPHALLPFEIWIDGPVSSPTQQDRAKHSSSESPHLHVAVPTDRPDDQPLLDGGHDGHCALIRSPQRVEVPPWSRPRTTAARQAAPSATSLAPGGPLESASSCGHRRPTSSLCASAS